MSNMCTCHIDPESCDWCRLQAIKTFFERSSLKDTTMVKDILWVTEKMEGYLIKEVSVAPQNEEVISQKVRAGMRDWENRCGSCRFFDTSEGRCKERNIFVKDTSPSCPQWRYFA